MNTEFLKLLRIVTVYKISYNMQKFSLFYLVPPQSLLHLVWRRHWLQPTPPPGYATGVSNARKRSSIGSQWNKSYQ